MYTFVHNPIPNLLFMLRIDLRLTAYHSVLIVNASCKASLFRLKSCYNNTWNFKNEVKAFRFIFLFLFQDNILIEKVADIFEKRTKQVVIDMKITNEDRTFASTLSYHISRLVRPGVGNRYLRLIYRFSDTQ